LLCNQIANDDLAAVKNNVYVEQSAKGMGISFSVFLRIIASEKKEWV
jgi:hypothetical protein